ncbi:hypothetical protein FIU97_12785 [Roseivivax sp. THAF40]|uniref:DUF1127 domain-containing protein n=1 Tax=unclassified Roseivivax TaxID=2639302 RepID=UPI00126823C5|nr:MULTISPECIES: DUF1127 domain-containing protein [unclassified Roseivivax]QFS83642.1 hypothetical protein FIV09_12465 [Roseivivax sp. THAF197b]QFT47450.1 hypothetical protein FIU97_12785 [Roseivivax sp. THAF40]
MSYAQTYSGTAATGTFARLKSSISEKLARRKVYRTTLNELSALSDRELRDLGLARSSLRGIAWQAAYDN